MLPYEYTVIHRKEPIFFKIILILTLIFLFILGTVFFPYTIFFKTYGFQKDENVYILLNQKQLEYLNHPIFLDEKKTEVLMIKEEYPNFYIKLKGKLSKENKIGVVKIKLKRTTIWKELYKLIIESFQQKS